MCVCVCVCVDAQDAGPFSFGAVRVSAGMTFTSALAAMQDLVSSSISVYHKVSA